MFWTDSTTGRFIHHGHTGIYVSTTKIAEAPGTGLKSHTMEASRKLVADRRKFRISTSSSVLNSQTPPKAVSWANKHLGIDYNNNFIANKHVDWGTYNCSQFVWAAYMSGGSGIPKVDLDSNGGSGVHPKDIRESKFVKVV